MDDPDDDYSSAEESERDILIDETLDDITPPPPKQSRVSKMKPFANPIHERIIGGRRQHSNGRFGFNP